METQSEVKSAVDGFYAALNAMFQGEAEPMLAVWSQSPEVFYLNPMGLMLRGWEAVRDDWQKQAELKLGGAVDTRDLQVVSGAELAVASCRVEGENEDEDGVPVAVSLRATLVLRLEGDEGWRVVGLHTDPIAGLTDRV